MERSRFTNMNLALSLHFANRLNERDDGYQRHIALFLVWESPCPDLLELGAVLEGFYGFEGELFKLTTNNTMKSLSNRVQSFIDLGHDASTLLLVYYSGGAFTKDNNLFWKPRGVDNVEMVEVDYISIQEMLQSCNSDVLLVTDCDYGDKPLFPQLHALPWAGKRMEIISAPSSASQHEANFIKRLIQALKSVEERSITVNRLSAKLVFTENRKTYSPYYFNLGSRIQSSISLLHLNAHKEHPVPLQISLKQRLDAGVEAQLRDWIFKAPPSITNAKFADHISGELKSCTLILSVTNPSVLDHESFQSWIGKQAPACLDNSIRHSIQPAIAKPISKTTQDKEDDREIEALVRKWNQERGWQRVQDTRSGNYRKVVVLPLIWEVTGFPENMIEKETESLMKIFRKYFNFHVEAPFQMPVGRDLSSQVVTENKIRSLIDPTRGLGREDLLVIYYNGHGRDTFGAGGGALWPGTTRDGRSETLNWSSVVNDLNNSECDVAQLLDCCYAASATKANWKGRNEVISACSRETMTLAGHNSFTWTLIRELEKLAKAGEPFSFHELYNKIDSETNRQNNSGIGRRVPQPHHKLFDPKMASIMLKPMPASQRAGAVLPRQVVGVDETGRQAQAYVYARIGVDDLQQRISYEYMTERQLVENLRTYGGTSSG